MPNDFVSTLPTNIPLIADGKPMIIEAYENGLADPDDVAELGAAP